MINQTLHWKSRKLKIEDRKNRKFQTSVADDTNDGVVFRINLEDLMPLAMQKVEAH